MKNSVLRMMTTLSCLLMCVYAEVKPIENFSLEKIAGKWYLSGTATNAEWFVNNKASMKMSTTTVTATEGGDLEISYANLKDDGSCWRMTITANKTDTPGRFTYYSQQWNNNNDMTVVDAVYDDYTLTYTIKTQENSSYVLINLYTRSPEASAEVQQKFTQLASSSEILAENIVQLPKNDECPAV